MKSINSCFFGAVILAMFGCTSKECDTKKEVITKQEGNLEIHKIINECENSHVISEQEYLVISKDSIVPHGFYKVYFPNGKLKLLAFAKLGIQDSVCITYSENGNKLTESYMSDGSFLGPQRKYYTTGELENVTYYKNDSVKWFSVDFDKGNKVLRYGGSPLRIVMKPGYESKKAGEEFRSIVEVPLLPRINSEVTLKLVKNGRIINDTTVSTFAYDKANFHYYPYFVDLKSAGKYEVIASIRLTSENDKALIVEDSLHLPITVK